ncbi:MAG: S8/S53 family peptidase, partial [Flavitalea sp.]
AGADDEYSSYSGTSMASPAASGSAFLLQEYYAKLHSGAFMRAATLKGIIIHTADEAGTSAGPDYQYGWGLMNMQKAAAVITAANNEQLIFERSLKNTGSDSVFTINLEASGNGPITATLSWTDPRAKLDISNTLNNTTPRLVNDLDLRVISNSEVSLPWILDPANPSAPATRGDNTRDNVEKITIANPTAGEKYTVKVGHKRSLDRADQAYSLIVSGAKLSADGGSNNLSLVVAPTVNAGRFNLQFLLEEKQDVSVSIFNMLGQRVYVKAYPAFLGQFSELISVPHLAKGIYILKLMHGDKEEIKKIIIARNL